MNNNFTILVQGRITEESWDFYNENYKHIDTVFSTWDNFIEFSAPKRDNIKVIKQHAPEFKGCQNANLQITSTLKGLYEIDTTYVIKVRGDEYYSNLEYVIKMVSVFKEKMFFSSIFFRKFILSPYHISDHIIAGNRLNMINMFEKAKEKLYDNNYWKGVPELLIGKAFMKSKGFDVDTMPLEEGYNKLKESARIININDLQPFMAIANSMRTTWRCEFNHEIYTCISDINHL